MPDTYYAHSTFNTEVNEWGQPQKTINPGDKITQGDLDCSDEDWDAYVESGVVSTVPYPDCQPGESANDAYAREDAALEAGTLDEKEAAKVKARQKAQADEAEVDESTPVVEVHKADAKEAAKPS